MGRPKVELCPEERKKLLKAKVMRCKGARLFEIANELNVKQRWLRYHLQEEYYENKVSHRVAITKEELARRKALVPVDTRDLTARICGDPIPNDPRRSAV